MKQRWLGVAAMQQPFDFLAIADIIYEVQPDVILETGVEGGGCLCELMSSVQQLHSCGAHAIPTGARWSGGCANCRAAWGWSFQLIPGFYFQPRPATKVPCLLLTADVASPLNHR